MIAEKQRNSDRYITSGDVNDTYKKICLSYLREPLSTGRLSQIISEFDTSQIINTKIKKNGRYGNTRVIEINNDTYKYLSKIDEILKEQGI
nr:hypothetical protein [Methanohalobium evestigatum]